MYANFAKFWDLIALENYEVTENYLAYIQHHKNKLSNILEYGCGSGFNLRRIRKSPKLNIVGVDISAAMLKIARREVKNVKFVAADMTSYATRQRFDLIFSANDSINHLLKISEWSKFFKNTAQQLSPQGAFLFDIATPHFFNSFSKEDGYFWKFKDCFLHFSLKKKKHIFAWNVHIFEKKRRDYYRYLNDVTLQRGLPQAQILKLLKAAGFKTIRRFNDVGTNDFVRCDRVYFECRRE